MDSMIVFLLSGIIILAAVLLSVIGYRKLGKPIDVEYFRTRWLEIENKLKANDPNTYHICVINADKLVDQALKVKGFKGQTMADRLKNAKTFLSDNISVWNAHKVRNKIAHEPDVKIEYKEARYALAGFRKSLKDLGVI